MLDGRCGSLPIPDVLVSIGARRGATSAVDSVVQTKMGAEVPRNPDLRDRSYDDEHGQHGDHPDAFGSGALRNESQLEKQHTEPDFDPHHNRQWQVYRSPVIRDVAVGKTAHGYGRVRHESQAKCGAGSIVCTPVASPHTDTRKTVSDFSETASELLILLSG
jgi:hypothetical protein